MALHVPANCDLKSLHRFSQTCANATACFVFLYLAVAGGGEWSADELAARSRTR